jgi:phosphate transport system substrate-binding protein
MENKTKFKLKIIISVLIGLFVGALSFIAWLLIHFFVQREVLWTLLGILFASIIVFLVLWNIKKSKKIYLFLLIPVICIGAGFAVLEYQHYVDGIPTVYELSLERRFVLYDYVPFYKYNSLAELDEESGLKITDNLPVLDGATALFPVYASFVQAVYPEDDYTVLFSPVNCNGTNKAYENLLEGKADIIFCAGPSEEQLKLFYDNDIKLKFVGIGIEAFVFFVNRENPADNLTIENIQGIYSGRIKNWRALSGVNQRIRAFQRPKNSGSQTMLEKVMGGIPIIKPRRENVSRGMGDIINEVAVYRNFPNAIGYSFLFFSTEMVKNEQIKLLPINGVYPSRETIQNESYSLCESFYAVYVDTDEKNENIEPFIKWILSRQGQELVQKTGYTSVNDSFLGE